MVSSVSSVALVPISALTARSVAVRPIEAGVVAPFDTNALRRDQTLQAETLDQARRDVARGESGDAGDQRENPGDRPGQTFRTGNAPFLAQLLAQDQPAERKRSPFADAAQAYGRFHGEPKTGFILDLPQRVDLKV